MKLAIIIPVHNREENIKKTLLCLSRQVIQQEHEVYLYVVDHASTDNTSKVIEEYTTNYFPFDSGIITQTLSVPRTKWSASIPRNAGAKLAETQVSPDAFIFLDSDILLPPDRIQRFVDDYMTGKDPQRVIIGPYHYMQNGITVENPDWYKQNIINYQQDVRWQSFIDHPVSEQNQGWEYALACFGGSILIPKDLFFKIGMYDEHCVAGVEDGDIGLTLWEAGATFSMDQSLLGWHNPHPITPQRTENIEEMKKYINEKHKMDIVYQTNKVYRKWGIDWADPLWKGENA